MRTQCLRCTHKHVCQACVLLMEYLGPGCYATHLDFAIGHLAEAENECSVSFPELADTIRDIRHQLSDSIAQDLEETAISGENLLGVLGELRGLMRAEGGKENGVAST